MSLYNADCFPLYSAFVLFVVAMVLMTFLLIYS